ncbi:MAG: hypothetical protein L3J16_02230 [Anaerolineales bacterium]|nr:hypothetical protein [Anaerolineales bacterium]
MPSYRNRLDIVEGHAFAKQGDVEFVADIALQFLGEEICAEVSAELEDAANNLRTANQQHKREQAV